MSNFQVYQKAILKVFSILFLLISFEISFADDQPFEVKANMATFGCDDQVSFLDIYYELYPAQWTYKEDVSNQ
ncbi:hypothetical protein HQ585_09220, partial [candidate division KSB1 bacterium]|nr:hypothetical protein [candidate division KSB1 bacterium]